MDRLSRCSTESKGRELKLQSSHYRPTFTSCLKFMYCYLITTGSYCYYISLLIRRCFFGYVARVCPALICVFVMRIML